MADRALPIAIVLSLAIHLLAVAGLSRTSLSADVARPPMASAPVKLRISSAPKPPPPQPAREARASPSPAAAAPVASEPPPRITPESAPKPAPPNKIARRVEPRAEPRPAPSPEPTRTPTPSPPPVSLGALDSSSRPDAPDGAPHEDPTESNDASSWPDASNPDDRLARYVEAIRSRIEEAKRYPRLARKRAVEGRVVARVAIRADGGISAVEFDRAAPALLRRATDRAIRSSVPYPPPPAGEITIEFPIDYSLRDAS